ncbi:MAG: DUF4835 family protein [Chitinophagaceae bacterium]|nr:DUF4835 family protein [Chitinophagaceae bacterium]MCW5905415.1 DUF4835 family protein [Chitinophagaceae bacterium]
MYRYFLLILLFTVSINTYTHAQELKAKVTVITSRIPSTVDKKIFNTLQTQLNNFLNNRKWSKDVFKENEKIVCNFLLNLESIAEQDVYKGSLTIQAARPIFNSSYQAALINFMDPDVTFKYVEYQPVEFNDNRVQGSDALAANLTAIFAYYAYMIMGLDYDSFSPKGGQSYFQKAQNIVNNAPEGKNISGWRVFDGLRNRYFFTENLMNTKYNIVHDVIYTYYRSGLDKMYEADKEARNNILQALSQLQNFNKENPNTMFVQFFMQGKANELIGIFKNSDFEEKNRALSILSLLDIPNITKYKEQLK